MSSSFVENLDDEEIEQLLAKAKEESLRFYHEIELPRQQLENEAQKPEETILSSQIGGKSLLYDGVEANGFHLSAGSTYIYPTNYPVRHYQASIVKTALFKNTLVSLPTGLGKTFIAAVVMYNFYRWYPHGKVVFMAPTRPLVAQQTKACHHIMNIPQDDTTEMTGAQSAEQRSVLWREKRVFYLTPQVMVNDLKVKACPASLIKCIVIDEAHRATKDYAYCQVLKILSETDAVFRILGLSATPGNDINAVQQVVQNLHISALEMRSEESMDVVPYVHSRAIDTVVVDLSDNIQRVKEDLLQVYEKYAKKLKDFKALSSNISAMSRFQVLKACEKFRAHPPRGLPPAMIGNLYSDFSVCMSLAHALELLQIYGLRAFYTYLSDENGDKNKGAATRLKNDEHLKEMLSRLQSCLYTKPNENNRYTWGHPKLQKLVAALSEHFQKAEQNKEPTKAIIFCQYRVVVAEIVDLLMKLKPLIKAAEFIGQSGGKEKGMPQAKQLQIMKDFRNGLINCLVATCVAEEGLDIGEVDLIILMEAHKSPVRLVQRIGRTGRKRKGRCIVLLTKGREEQKFHDAMATRKSYVQNIVNAPAVKSSLCQESPRMIPPQCNPVQQLVHIQPSNFESPARPGGKRQTDIRKCFTAQVPAGQSSDSSETDLLKAMEELGDLKLTFNCIPERREFWIRRHDVQIPIEELLSKDINGLSEWNEWNHEEQPSYYISHTSQSKLLCHILKVANKEVLLPFCDNISDSNINANVDEENNLIVKEMGKIKKEVKKNKGMDIRSCMAAVAEKNKTPEKQIIEILSDSSEDVFPSLCPEPEPKRLKISKPDEPEIPITNDITISAYEENNNICSFLGNYILPKSAFKKQFSFSLPSVETVLNKLSFEIIVNLNIEKLSVGKTTLENNESAVKSVIRSPLSSTFFEIDDLFDEENICQDKEEISNPCLETYHFSQKVIVSNHVTDTNVSILDAKSTEKPIVESANDVIHPEFPQSKYNEVSKNSEKSLIETVLNGQINSEMDLSFADSDEEYFNIDDVKAEEINSPKVVFTGQFGVINASVEERAPSRWDSKVDEPLGDCTALAPPPKEICTINRNNNVPPVSDEQPMGEAVHSLYTPQKSSQVENEKSSVNNGKIDIPCFDSKSQAAHISGIACSTPIASVKKFKKNVIKIESSAPLFTEKENDIKKSPSSEGSDMWNLSDLFEDEEDKPAPHEDTTMLGITQMVSLIEKEKKHQCISTQISTANQVESVSNKSEKTSNFSAFLDSDVDIFTEVNDNFHNALPTISENITKSYMEVISPKHNFMDIEDRKRQFIQKDEVFSSPFPVKKEIPHHNMKSVENINSFQSNNDVCKNVISTKCHSLSVFDSFEIEKSYPIHQSQSVNFKKFTGKKILFSQKLDSQCITNKKEDGILEESYSNLNSETLMSENVKPSYKDTIETTTKRNDKSNKTFKNEVLDRIPQIMSDDSDDDVFFVRGGKEKAYSEKRNSPLEIKPKDVIFSSTTKQRSFEERKTSKIKRNPKAHNGLIEVEADVSGFDSCDDSDGSSLDDFDNSFINDDSECITNCTQTIYLKSVKSPVGQGKFKIPNNINYEDNVFSQQIPEDSEYINDSFCVESEGETDEENDRSLSILEIAEKKLRKKTKGKNEKRKRLRIQSESSASSSPEKSFQKNISMSQPSPKAAMNRKKRRISSDSETEVNKDVSFSFKKKKKENLQLLSPSTELTSNEHSPSVNKLDKSLQKLTKKFVQNLDKIKQKYIDNS